MVDTPLANEFVTSDLVGKDQDLFPLSVHVCKHCGHAQLPVIVNPERLFRDYVYVSGTSSVFVSHFEKYAESLIEQFNLKSGSLVIDIGSNDGTLLKFFKKAGMRVLGIDPAKEIAQKATESGIETVPEFFSTDLADDIAIKYGRASLVVANNVFAHAHDLAGIVHGIKRMTRSSAPFVFEVSYLVDVISKVLFDTIYHEHLSYHTVGPLIPFFKSCGMELFDVHCVNTHGGSIRCYAGWPGRLISSNLHRLLKQEYLMGFKVPDLGVDNRFGERLHPLIEFRSRITALHNSLKAKLVEIKNEGKSIAGFGAPAKATTLMYQFDLGPDILDFIVDDSPLKQGLFTPGKHIPVLSSAAIEEKRPDYLLILAWNFADSIIAKNKYFRDRGGKFIVPIPELREY
jgi:SAM-dependent methyltransferase